MYNTDDRHITYDVVYAIEHQYGTKNLRDYIDHNIIQYDEVQ